MTATEVTPEIDKLRKVEEILRKGVPITLADDWTEAQRNEFVIKDNASYGENNLL